ncbi:MAG: putative manganese-dependent inorganic diphosphatase, partial [Candidatus Cloacimonetes bacterium]|nr:putative manganese-dependent inorganic diphosphatase [Candidatus Cloacimonadota bacterium]
LGLEPPAFVRDVHPKAEDIMLSNIFTVNQDDPVGLATQLIDEHKVRTIPVVDSLGNYAGLVTVMGLAHYFMPKHFAERPYYTFRPENFIKVIPGCYLQKGSAVEFEAQMMVGAMAFDTFISRLQCSMKEQKQTYPLLIVGNRPDVIEYSLKQDFPVIIFTGMDAVDCEKLDISGYKGWIYISEVDTAETIRLLRTSIPVKAIASTVQPTLKISDNLSEIKKIMMNRDHHGLAVLEGEKLLGLVSSSCMIDPPKHQVIMIDHNEAAQSVEGIEQAEVIEILDHHRLGAIRTPNPIYVYAKPLGSSCTIVYKHFQSFGIKPPPEIAALLLSGILSDTIILRSPTTTAEDISAAEELAVIVSLDLQDWGTDIFRHAASLSSANPEQAVTADFKIYTENSHRVGIAQMEVITLNDLASVEQDYLNALYHIKQKFALDWAMLLITDIIGEESILICTEFALADNLIYHRLDANTFHLPAVLSRKKQLLPEILNVLSQ